MTHYTFETVAEMKKSDIDFSAGDTVTIERPIPQRGEGPEYVISNPLAVNQLENMEGEE